MPVTIATESDFDDVAALVNSAFRGDSSRSGWTTEADFLGGQRTDVDALRAELAERPGSVLLVMRDAPGAELLGSVRIEPRSDEEWHLGMLTVRPDQQNRHLGRTLLAEAEAFAAARGARRMHIGVIGIRDTLIAWYERRGYERTGEVLPFPYGNARFGEPMRDDLDFIGMVKKL